MPITIRNMRDEDCAAVSLLVCAVFSQAARREGESEEAIRRYTNDRGSPAAIAEQFDEEHFILACTKSSIVGVISLRGGEITKLYVSSKRIRQGIGAALFCAAQKQAGATGHKELTAWVHFDSAIPFYEAMGMCDVGRKFDLLSPGPGSNALLVKKQIVTIEK